MVDMQTALGAEQMARIIALRKKLQKERLEREALARKLKQERTKELEL